MASFILMFIVLGTTSLLAHGQNVTNPADDEPLCAYQADLGFLVDASSSIGDADFEKMKTFIKGVIRIFDVANNKVRISMLKYYKNSEILFNLNTYTTKDDILQAVDNTYGTAIGTRTDLALKLARTILFTPENGDRATVPNIAILLTDGQSSFPDWTAEQQQLLKDTTARVFVMGIGKKIDQNELDLVASMPTNVFSHKVANFDGLELILEEFAKTACYAITLPPYVPPPATSPSTVPTTAPETTTEPATTATLPEFTTVILCQDAADVLILMDASSSIGDEDFAKMKHFLMGLVAHFDVGQDRVRIGLITYNIIARTQFDLNTYSTRVDVMQGINGLQGTRIGTRTDHALIIARRVYQAENGNREGIPKVIILLTDGRSTYDTWTEREAALTKEIGAKIFVIGIGKRIDEAELNMIASGPQYNHMVDDFDGLNEILGEFAKTACSGVQGDPGVHNSTTVSP